MNRLALSFLAVCAAALPAFAETIELVTYYPTTSSTGDLHVRSITVGTGYQGVDMSANDGVALVEDRLGIGTNAPQGSLHIIGPANTPDNILFAPGTGTGTIRLTIGNAGLGLPTAEGTISAGDKLVMWNAAAPGHKAAIGLNTNSELWLQSSGNSANNKIAFYTSNNSTTPSQRMVINAQGQVGIGTPTPNASLRVHSANTPSTLLLSGNAAFGPTNSGLYLSDQNAVPGTNGWGVLFQNTGNLQFVYRPGGVGEQVILQLNQTANAHVGIGTTNPLRRLHIANATAGNAELLRLEQRAGGGRQWDVDILQSGTLAILDPMAAGAARFSIDGAGRTGIGTANPICILDVRGAAAQPSGVGAVRTLMLSNGNAQNTNTRFLECVRSGDGEFVVFNNGDVRADTGFTSPADYAEWLETADTDLAPGELVSIDPARPNHVRRATIANDPLLFGIVSTKPGIVGVRADDVTDAAEQREKDPRWKKVAFLGQVPTKVTGDIAVGDPITSSSLPGVGMKAAPGDPRVAVALEPHQGTGPDVINCAMTHNSFNADLSALTQSLEEMKTQNKTLRDELQALKTRLQDFKK